MVRIHVLGKHQTCRTGGSGVQKLHIKRSYIYVVYEYFYIFTVINKESGSLSPECNGDMAANQYPN